MELLPDELLAQLRAQTPSKRSGRELTQDEELVLVRFRIPAFALNWCAASASVSETGEVEFFGLAVDNGRELGYFTLSHLLALADALGEDLVRDPNWQPIPLIRLLERMEVEHGAAA